jgi:hypothetical protein
MDEIKSMMSASVANMAFQVIYRQLPQVDDATPDEYKLSAEGFIRSMIPYLSDEQNKTMGKHFIELFRKCLTGSTSTINLYIQLIIVTIPYLNEEHMVELKDSLMEQNFPVTPSVFSSEPHTRMFTLFNSELAVSVMELFHQLITYSSAPLFHLIFMKLYEKYTQYKVFFKQIKYLTLKIDTQVIYTNYTSLLDLFTWVLDNKFIHKGYEQSIVGLFNEVHDTGIPNDLDLKFFSSAVPYVGEKNNMRVLKFELLGNLHFLTFMKELLFFYPKLVFVNELYTSIIPNLENPQLKSICLEVLQLYMNRITVEEKCDLFNTYVSSHPINEMFYCILLDDIPLENTLNEDSLLELLTGLTDGLTPESIENLSDIHIRILGITLRHTTKLAISPEIMDKLVALRNQIIGKQSPTEYQLQFVGSIVSYDLVGICQACIQSKSVCSQIILSNLCSMQYDDNRLNLIYTEPGYLEEYLKAPEYVPTQGTGSYFDGLPNSVKSSQEPIVHDKEYIEQLQKFLQQQEQEHNQLLIDHMANILFLTPHISKTISDILSSHGTIPWPILIKNLNKIGTKEHIRSELISQIFEIRTMSGYLTLPSLVEEKDSSTNPRIKKLIQGSSQYPYNSEFNQFYITLLKKLYGSDHVTYDTEYGTRVYKVIPFSDTDPTIKISHPDEVLNDPAQQIMFIIFVLHNMNYTCVTIQDEIIYFQILSILKDLIDPLLSRLAFYLDVKIYELQQSVLPEDFTISDIDKFRDSTHRVKYTSRTERIYIPIPYDIIREKIKALSGYEECKDPETYSKLYEAKPFSEIYTTIHDLKKTIYAILLVLKNDILLIRGTPYYKEDYPVFGTLTLVNITENSPEHYEEYAVGQLISLLESTKEYYATLYTIAYYDSQILKGIDESELSRNSSYKPRYREYSNFKEHTACEILVHLHEPTIVQLIESTKKAESLQSEINKKVHELKMMIKYAELEKPVSEKLTADLLRLTIENYEDIKTSILKAYNDKTREKLRKLIKGNGTEEGIDKFYKEEHFMCSEISGYIVKNIEYSLSALETQINEIIRYKTINITPELEKSYEYKFYPYTEMSGLSDLETKYYTHYQLGFVKQHISSILDKIESFKNWKIVWDEKTRTNDEKKAKILRQALEARAKWDDDVRQMEEQALFEKTRWEDNIRQRKEHALAQWDKIVANLKESPSSLIFIPVSLLSAKLYEVGQHAVGLARGAVGVARNAVGLAVTRATNISRKLRNTVRSGVKAVTNKVDRYREKIQTEYIDREEARRKEFEEYELARNARIKEEYYGQTEEKLLKIVKDFDIIIEKEEEKIEEKFEKYYSTFTKNVYESTVEFDSYKEQIYGNYKRIRNQKGENDGLAYLQRKVPNACTTYVNSPKIEYEAAKEKYSDAMIEFSDNLKKKYSDAMIEFSDNLNQTLVSIEKIEKNDKYASAKKILEETLNKSVLAGKVKSMNEKFQGYMLNYIADFYKGQILGAMFDKMKELTIDEMTSRYEKEKEEAAADARNFVNAQAESHEEFFNIENLGFNEGSNEGSYKAPSAKNLIRLDKNGKPINFQKRFSDPLSPNTRTLQRAHSEPLPPAPEKPPKLERILTAPISVELKGELYTIYPVKNLPMLKRQISEYIEKKPSVSELKGLTEKIQTTILENENIDKTFFPGLKHVLASLKRYTSDLYKGRSSQVPEGPLPGYLRVMLRTSGGKGIAKKTTRGNKPIIRKTKRLNRLGHKKTVSVRRTRRGQVVYKS